MGRLLTDRGWTISVAETTAGGLISARILAVPGSSAYFDSGIVAYSKRSKVQMLGIDEGVLGGSGAVSEEAALALADGVRRRSDTTFGLAETGIAGPVRGRSPKPIGTAYIAIVGEGIRRCDTCRFSGDRQAIRSQIAERSVTVALEALQGLCA